MRRTYLKKVSDRRREQLVEKKETTSELHRWFLSLWDEREKDGKVKCFETGAGMLRQFYRENSASYSHILPKSLYPQFSMCSWNVVIVLPAAHHQFEIYPEKATKQFELKKKLLYLLEKGELQCDKEILIDG